MQERRFVFKLRLRGGEAATRQVHSLKIAGSIPAPATNNEEKTMRKFLTAVALMAVAGSVYAACTTQTITMPDGKMMFCTTCCFNGNCNTTCM